MSSPQKVPLRGGPENSIFNFNGYPVEHYTVRGTERHPAEVPSAESLAIFGMRLISGYLDEIGWTF